MKCRGGENKQLAPRVKNENRVLPGTSREANLWSDATTPIPTECSQIQRQPATQTAQQSSPLNLPQLNVTFDQDLNRIIDQTLNRNVAIENRADPLLYRGGKVSARKPEVFSESMKIDEWIESLKAYLSGTNTNAATHQVLIAQVKSFLRSTALKRVKYIFMQQHMQHGCSRCGKRSRSRRTVRTHVPRERRIPK